MKEQSFFWHDYETWGADPRRDRASQFAGIRTDTDLNVIGEPVSFYCRPADDMLPQPEACLVTGITPQKAMAEGVSEADFFARVHEHLAQPGTCGVGYNSLRFDDEFTRYGFYRNFFDPYGREWQNGNGRWDIIDMARLCRALRPEGIEWPTREDGAPSFRLEELTAANGIEHFAAHDALSDVYATIALARLIRERQPRLYHYVLEHKDKGAAGQLFDLNSKKPVLHISGMFPATSGSAAVVMPLIRHPINRNGIIVYDLRWDPQDWLSLDEGEILERLYTPSDELPEGEARIALKTVHLNKCPVIVPLNTLTDRAKSEWQIDLEQCERHRQTLLAVDGLSEMLEMIFSESPFESADDPDHALYDGFIGDSDRRLGDRIRSMLPDELGGSGFVFEDRRMDELLFRYRARNWPQSLNEEERGRWEEYRRERLTDPFAGASITLNDYRMVLAALRQQRPERAELLEALEQWPQVLGISDE